MTAEDVINFPVEITFGDLQWCIQMSARYCADCSAEANGKPKCEGCTMPATRARLKVVRRITIEKSRQWLSEFEWPNHNASEMI